MSKPPVELSIVIVNSDGLMLTKKCIESIYLYPLSVSFEVILVDNCSEVSPFPIIHEQFPHVRTFEAPCRQGFSKNYNLGIQNSKGNYILSINNDTLILEGALDALLNFMNEKKDYGIVGPKLINSNGRIQPVCARSLLTPITYIIGQLFLDQTLPIGRIWEYISGLRLGRKKSGRVPCISGACMLVSSETIRKVGYLNENYDFYFEDIEWCHRIHNAGLKVGYVADAQVIHLGDQSLSRVREWAKKSEYLSGLQYFREYHGLKDWQVWLFQAAMTLNFLLRWMLFSIIEIITGKPGQREAYRNLIYWILHQNPITYLSNV